VHVTEVGQQFLDLSSGIFLIFHLKVGVDIEVCFDDDFGIQDIQIDFSKAELPQYGCDTEYVFIFSSLL